MMQSECSELVPAILLMFVGCAVIGFRLGLLSMKYYEMLEKRLKERADGSAERAK